MATSKKSFTRRKWLGAVSTAAVGSGWILGAAPASVFPAKPASTLGVRIYNIRDFGAKGDGKTLDTAAVQSAIDTCNRDQGGTVLVPAGVFVIGTVELKSNVTLRIASQGKLLGSADGKQYRAADAIPLRGDTTLRDGNVGLIFAVNAENITVEGPGTIDGQGAEFHSPRRGVPPPSGRGGDHRPYHLLFYRCKNVRIRDLYLVASAYHSVRLIESRFFWADGVHICNRVNTNNDGFHFISSEYVHVSNCDVQSQDDACALFGGCRNVTITNSTFSTRWAVFRFGGGNPENVTISNCVIYETYGCPIKMQFGPESRAQNILFSNLVMQDVTGPISIDLNSRQPHDGGTSEPTEKGFVRNIMFNGLRAHVLATGRPLPGLPLAIHYRPGETRQCIALNSVQNSFLENVVLNDVHITYEGGGTAEEAARVIPPIAGEYFEMGTPPAYGLYARKVRGLSLSNVRFEVEQPDLRPAIVFDHVVDAAVNGFSAPGNTRSTSVFRFIETSEALITAARVLSPATVFLQVEGRSSKNITVEGGDLSKAKRPLMCRAGAAEGAVKLRS